jgi:HEAT repeat protein
LLLELLEDPDLDVRLAAIWALSQVGGKGVRKALENLLETRDDDEEADQIEKALENLDFTEEMRDLALLEIPEEGDESSEDDYDNNNDDFISEDDED